LARRIASSSGAADDEETCVTVRQGYSKSAVSALSMRREPRAL
jgi:hypothetical protein